ncbi:MarR family winged helix-turn-helix transcriptional regulator [Streptacidiphilus sp. P02-A3a]|uniref:MarR family winged helix-turn-helix transcriptional regulator n=1 Tax=Streptacidiphilus sp. P02-A3a TaxID=2704468 RepID=UPI001CDC9497|nr:MarR family winged helix-turn-helix transcriptional regulator [Streptacidiphilus sp. P02-A3a]QMU66994.1 winged helix-turn-helix transcriptional regulator [Streptacidiphilus sp. P02-A3a]
MSEPEPAGPAEAPAEAVEAAVAATAMGDEMTRFIRLVNATKHRLRDVPGGGDRILLGRLVHEGPRRATDLAAETFLDLSTVSRQVKCLIDRGLVERRPDPEDRRGALLSATDAGAEAYQHHRSQRNEHLARIFDAWPPEDRHQLVRLFGRFNDDLAEHYHQLFDGHPGAIPSSAAAAQQGDDE